jgi:hypothetical protein
MARWIPQGVQKKSDKIKYKSVDATYVNTFEAKSGIS